ncbi:MAG: ATP-binding protein [Candidatus Acidiferrales bacterium]
MPLSLKTKFTLATTLLVLGVVMLVSWLYIARLTRQVIRQDHERANFVAQEVFGACQQALMEASEQGGPAPGEDVREYVRRALDNSSTLNFVVESAIGYSPNIYEITISDRSGLTLESSDASVRGRRVFVRPAYKTLEGASFLYQLRVLYGPPSVYEITLPFDVGPSPFGEIGIGLSSVFLRNEISPGLEQAGWAALAAVLLSTLFAAIVSHATLAPLARISAQLDKISAGEFDLEPVTRGDELGLVSTKISRIGQQLRDVREIFSTLRENLNQVMVGLEDGLLLFNAEGRAVLVSPSAEKFLGATPSAMMGRQVGEIFAFGHPLRNALRIEDDEIQPVDSEEARLDSPAGPRRVGVSAQPIREKGKRMGTLVTLRDLESLERIGSQLQVSERLAALGRVTAGVAHEVKNPLNSMRVWLEVLKSNLPVEPESQQALKMLDSEIDRLDRAVKTFLDFTHPVEIELAETDLVTLLREVLDSARPAIHRAHVQLLAQFPENFPPVRADRPLIHQAVLNLILNACDAMTPGGKLSISLAQNGENAEIKVSDTGKGITPENRRKIFQLFFTTRPGGTGIGLANTFRFVQLHNGSIEFESEVGRGTMFRILLPLSRTLEASVVPLRDYGQPFAQGKT